MWCCSTNVLKADGKYRKSVFDKKQIDSLRSKFNYVSGNQQYINRQTFKKNIGYLGIRAVNSFLDRIFNSFDIDQDNKISLDDFIEYMQILKDGTDDQKAQISFNLIYMQEIIAQKKQQKGSFSKGQEGTTQQRTRPQKKKIIDVVMFQKFFQDFYKSWSSITNESIASQTKLALKTFIQELFRKVQTDGRKTIDLDYYKMLYKDRQFMMAFRQINSKLGNFFIKSSNNQFQKNVTLIHKILKKIHSMFDKCFPLLNDNFMQDAQKSKERHSCQTPVMSNINQTQNDDITLQNVDKYFYDAKRYEFQNIFENNQHSRFQFTQNLKSSPSISKSQKNNLFSVNKGQKSNLKQMFKQANISESSYEQNPLYKKGLQDHVVFLQKKLLFIENSLKQIIEQSKQMYDEMHQQFVKILQRIQRQQNLKQSEMKQYNYTNNLIVKQNQLKNTQTNNRRKDKKQNKHNSDNKVFFGDKNFNLVLQIMVGIQMSVRSVSGFQQIIFQQPQDFHLKHTFQMDYGHFGENDILYTFTDYAPNVFNHIRKVYQIQNESYINSIGPNKMMSALILGRMASFEELVSEGKSGSFFYHTEDGKYLIKTISQKQFYFMRKLLQKYFRHVKTNPQTLIPRFFGLHKITSTMKRDYSKNSKMVFYLIVMNNFFNTNDRITESYDLKGSWVGRQNTSGKGIKKDTNFIKEKKRIDIEKSQKLKIFQIVEKDANFFAQNNIIDYSLLVGCVQTIHQKNSRIPRAHSLFDIGNQFLFQSVQRQKSVHILDEKKSMNFKFKSQSNRSSSYLLGVIDILTEYNSKKQAEHLFKSCIYDSKGISAVPPQEYKNRFLNFIAKQVFRIDIKSQKSKSKTQLQPTHQKSSKSKDRKKAHSQHQSIY